MSEIYGQPTRRLTNATLALEVFQTAGPRIVRLQYKDSSNLLAELPDFVVPTSQGNYHFWGGHRLWHAPEALERTYTPEDEGVTITDLPGGLALEGPVEGRTGISKQIEVRLDPDRPIITLTHVMTNHGLWAVELASWALTQLRLGGIVIAPMPVGNRDPDGLLPNRQLSLWPYARMRDPRVHWDDDFITIEADAAMPPFKFGYFNPHGWLAYWIDGVLFRKVFDVHPKEKHPDNNSNAEVYCNDQFVELESLGPLTRLQPGDRVEHTEVWELYDDLDQPFLGKVIERL